jgi:hypothetical protein
MGEVYFILKKKGSSKEAKVSTEEIEGHLRKAFEDKVKKMPWYIRPLAKVSLEYFGEALAFGLEKCMDLYNEKKK